MNDNTLFQRILEIEDLKKCKVIEGTLSYDTLCWKEKCLLNILKQTGKEEDFRRYKEKYKKGE